MEILRRVSGEFHQGTHSLDECAQNLTALQLVLSVAPSVCGGIKASMNEPHSLIDDRGSKHTADSSWPDRDLVRSGGFLMNSGSNIFVEFSNLYYAVVVTCVINN